MSFRDELRRQLRDGCDRDRGALFALLWRSRCYEYSATPVVGGTHVLIAGGDHPHEFLVELIVRGEPRRRLRTADVYCSSARLADGDGRRERWRLSTSALLSLYAHAANEHARGLARRAASWPHGPGWLDSQ